MALRTGLHDLLSEILSSFGVWLWDTIPFDETPLQEEIEKEAARHVYYQPPENFKMVYPCIVYERTGYDTIFANDKPYANTKQYTITVIDKNADSLISDKVAQLPRCGFDRHFTFDRLHHDVFKIYY
jgi:hypothetical protein